MASPNIFRHSPTALNPVGECALTDIQTSNHALLLLTYDNMCSHGPVKLTVTHRLQCYLEQIQHNAGCRDCVLEVILVCFYIVGGAKVSLVGRVGTVWGETLKMLSFVLIGNPVSIDL